jgi:hypothetical protein
MGISVLHLVGRFPALYERAIMEEIAAVGREGIANRIVALHPSDEALPEEFAALGRLVSHLDVARQAGRPISGGISLLAGIIAAAPSPGFIRVSSRDYSFSAHGWAGSSAVIHRRSFTPILGTSDCSRCRSPARRGSRSW